MTQKIASKKTESTRNRLAAEDAQKAGLLGRLSRGERLFYIIALVVLGVTAVPLVMRLAYGLTSTTDVNNLVPWGLWVVFYIYFVGISAGSFLISALSYGLDVKAVEPVRRIGLLVSILGVAIGGVFIGLDIGRWDRILNTFLYFHWTSALSWEVRFFLVYIVLDVIMLVTDIRLARNLTKTPQKSRNLLKILAMVNTAVTLLGVLGTEAMIFSTNETRPMWYGSFLPVKFTVSALVAGAATLLFLHLLHSKINGRARHAETQSFLSRALMWGLAADALMLFFEFFVPVMSAEQDEMAVLKWMTTGPTWWTFWIVELLLGIVVAFALLAKGGSDKPRFSLWGAVFALVGLVAVRYNIVVPPQIRPLLDGYNAGSFEPTIHEWLITIFLFTAFALIYYSAVLLFPAINSSEKDLSPALSK
ncbi:MAG: polysulfide reductase NrfD [Actinomycetaceae bacterium]|nr:polysulfide reductase NrfD [Actinomycetaceae bacterium]